MTLSGREIEKQLGKKIIIETFNEKQLNPNSYNVKLHEDLLVYDENILDMKKQNKTKKITIPENGFVLEPNKLYLGRTVEYVKTDYYVPKLEGRSSIARLGIFVHICAGLGQIGSSGCWTLEIACVQPVRIYPNIEICQLFFQTIEGEYDLYKNKYKDDREVQASLLYKELK